MPPSTAPARGRGGAARTPPRRVAGVECLPPGSAGASARRPIAGLVGVPRRRRRLDAALRRRAGRRALDGRPLRGRGRRAGGRGRRRRVGGGSGGDRARRAAGAAARRRSDGASLVAARGAGSPTAASATKLEARRPGRVSAARGSLGAALLALGAGRRRARAPAARPRAPRRSARAGLARAAPPGRVTAWPCASAALEQVRGGARVLVARAPPRRARRARGEALVLELDRYADRARAAAPRTPRASRLRALLAGERRPAARRRRARRRARRTSRRSGQARGSRAARRPRAASRACRSGR